MKKSWIWGVFWREKLTRLADRFRRGPDSEGKRKKQGWHSSFLLEQLDGQSICWDRKRNSCGCFELAKFKVLIADSQFWEEIPVRDVDLGVFNTYKWHLIWSHVYNWDLLGECGREKGRGHRTRPWRTASFGWRHTHGYREGTDREVLGPDSKEGECLAKGKSCQLLTWKVGLVTGH